MIILKLPREYISVFWPTYKLPAWANILSWERKTWITRICILFIGKKIAHGDCRIGAIKKLKNLAIWGVLIRGILEVGFSCFCERVVSLVLADGGSQWPSWGALSPKMKRGLGALASGRSTQNSDRRGLVCWSECPPSLADLMRLRRSLQYLSFGCQWPGLLSAKKMSFRYCVT